MLTQGFGEVLTDILTVNPAIRTIPSASAILDTSNYTFNAITLGKDGQGFLQHGHSIVSDQFIGIAESIVAYFAGFTTFPQQATLLNDQFLTTLRYNTLSPSSYHSSSTHLQLSSNYNSIPNYPSIYDTRLERSSTKTSVEVFRGFQYSDLGHYANPAADPDTLQQYIYGVLSGTLDPALAGLLSTAFSSTYFSSLWNVMGYPPSGNIGNYRLLSSTSNLNAPAVSGSLSGVFNSKQIIDKKGFIKINESINVTSLSAGPYIISATGFSTDPAILIGVGIQRGDAVALALLGGVRHIGVWCLDLKQMLKSGLNPPYTWNYLNNNRKYKLVAKVTFWDDILFNEDVGGTPGLTLLDTSGVLTKLKFNFK
jgi:hypothetical protein